MIVFFSLCIVLDKVCSVTIFFSLCTELDKVRSVIVFFFLCTVLGKDLQELEAAIQVTMDCDFYPKGQMCRVGNFFMRIVHDKVETAQYINCAAVVVEVLKDSKEQTKRRMQM